MKFWG